MALNYSFHGLTAYLVLAFVPHLYATVKLKNANNGNYNNVNPRGADTIAAYKKTVPSDVLGCFERAKAAHSNMMENAPYFIGAVLAGNVAGLSPDTMNVAVGTYLALRVVYILLYINVTRRKYSHLRSLVWASSTFLLIGIFVKAGNKLVAQSENIRLSA